MAIYINMDDIKGSCTRDNYKDQVEVSSASFSAHRSGTGNTGSGAAGGEAFASELSFSKELDASSVELYKRVLNGKPIPNTVITWTKSDGEAEVEFYKVTLTDSLITSYSNSASGGQGTNVTPMESFTLNFKKTEFAYTSQNNDGTAGAEITGNWSVEKGKAE
jgi:type VI secretion system secreted protein Hcp